MSYHYVSLDDGTVWPVNVGDIEWALRYGVLGNPQRLIAASVLNAYSTLTDPSLSARDAQTRLARARRAQREALLRAVPGAETGDPDE